MANRTLKKIYHLMPKPIKPVIMWAYHLFIKNVYFITNLSKVNKLALSEIKEDIPAIEEFVSKSSSLNLIVFPVIDWGFREQRPQHLTKELVNIDCKAVYLTTRFNYSKEPGFIIESQLQDDILICRLNANKESINIYKDTLEKEQYCFIVQSVNLLRNSLNLGFTTSIIDHPFWRQIVESLSSNIMIYDCMDYHAGFENNDNYRIIAEEKKLLISSDLVVATSQRLSAIISNIRDNIIIRNAAEVAYFSADPSECCIQKNKPIVGYYGAIAEWFDVELVAKCAENYPNYDFVLIGQVTCDVSILKKKPNVIFLGEIPYKDLTKYLKAFDVCLIPFKIIELTLCTNPVKVYEYLVTGKPVVCTAMPEVKIIDEYVHVAGEHQDFIDSIELAMSEIDNEDLYTKRREWALTNDWSSRAIELKKQLVKLHNTRPKVSIVILTYNNLHLTKECLISIEKNTGYNNYEVILVDNASTDGTRDFLRKNYFNKVGYKVILNDSNLGFSGGNNIGLEAATGDTLVILNNDTFVGPFWLDGLVKSLNKYKKLGIVGPVTNNIGNEAKINISYTNWSEMDIEAIRYCANNSNKIYYTNCVAFFCVAFSRKIYNEIGPMSLEYGLGFFEDDDYCMRLKKAGYDIGIVEDSFVHHHLSASFSKLKYNKKKELMDRNKTFFEKKWGKWQPHKYRKGVS